MMKKYKIEVFRFLFLISVPQILCCGPARPVLEEASSNPALPPPPIAPEPTQSIAQQLGLKIVRESGNERGRLDFKRPETIGRRAAAEERLGGLFRYQGAQMSFNRTLRLKKNQHLFFVWPENSLGHRIQQAFARHSILNGNNQWIGKSRFVSVFRDFENSIWFLSLSDLFHSEEGAPRFLPVEADTQVLVLEILFENQTRLEIEVRFRARMEDL